MIDNLPPVATFVSYTENNNGNYMHAIGSTMYFNPAGNGSFNVNVDANDAMSGVNRVEFPDFNLTGSNWSVPGTDSASPYTWNYAWTAVATAPTGTVATAFDNAGNSSTAAFTILADANPPVGGSVTYPGGPTKEASIDITFTPSSDSESGYDRHYLQRRQAQLVGNTCGAYGSWGNMGGTSPASPFTDRSTVDGYCYQYRVLTHDKVDNSTPVEPGITVKVDRTAPTGTISANPAGPVPGTQTISGTSTDATTDVASVAVKYDGPSTGTMTGCTGILSWSCIWDTTQVGDGLYTITLEVTDLAGNREALPITRTIVVDNLPPVVSFNSFTEGSNANYQHVVGSTIYFNPHGSGDFMVAINATDAGSGMNRVEFPDLNLTGSGWSAPGADPTAPYSWFYAWSANATAPTGTVATGFDNAGNSTTAGFTILADGSDPVGGAITYAGGPTNAPDIDITFTPSSDTESGYDRHYLQRRQAQLTGNSCIAWGAWSNQGGTSPSSTFTDGTIDDGYCYEYRLITHDKVDNAHIIAPGTIVKVDRTAPYGNISALPTGPVRLTNTISGTSADATTDVSFVTVKYTGPSTGVFGVCTGILSWSCTWDTTQVADGVYTLSLEVTDLAGNREAAVINRTIMVDNTPPNASFINYTEGANPNYQHAIGSVMYYNPAGNGDFAVNVASTDPMSGMNRVEYPDLNITGSNWSANGADPTSPYSWTYAWVPIATAPTGLLATAFDNAGNSATVPFTILSDSGVPTGGSINYTGGPTNAPKVDITFTPSSDSQSGYDRHYLQRRQASLSGNTCGTFGAWANLGGTSPASTYEDFTVLDGFCYEYQLITHDKVDNFTVITPGTIVKVDRTAPIGAISANPPGPVAGTQTISGTSADATTDVASVAIKYAGASTGTMNNCTGILSWSCIWDTTQVGDGLYTLTLEVTDLAGNREASVISRTIVVDNLPPTVTFNSFTEGGNPNYQYADGSTMYFNPVGTGDFNVNIDATDVGSGMNRVEFPDFNLTGTNWSAPGSDPASPYTWNYAWTAGATAPTGIFATGFDNAGNSTDAGFTILADTVDPVGGNISYPGGPTAALDIDVEFTPSTDADSGYERHYLQRRQTPLSGNTCGTYGAWTNFGGTSPASPFTDASINHGFCYQYRLVTHDHVDNTRIIAPATTVKVDRV